MKLTILVLVLTLTAYSQRQPAQRQPQLNPVPIAAPNTTTPKPEIQVLRERVAELEAKIAAMERDNAYEMTMMNSALAAARQFVKNLAVATK